MAKQRWDLMEIFFGLLVLIIVVAKIVIVTDWIGYFVNSS